MRIVIYLHASTTYRNVEELILSVKNAHSANDVKQISDVSA
jgi:hypothetical protein